LSRSPSPDLIRVYGTLAVEGLSEFLIGQVKDLEGYIRTKLKVLKNQQASTDPLILGATAEAYAQILDSNIFNKYIRDRGMNVRLEIIENLDSTLIALVAGRQTVLEQALKVLGENLPYVIHNPYYWNEKKRIQEGLNYVRLLYDIARSNPTRKPEIRDLIASFDAACGAGLALLEGGQTKSQVKREIRELQGYVRRA
jgi:hypothetical protein